MADVQIAVIDPEDTQLALAAPAEAVVNVAVPGVQGPIGLTGSVAIAQAGTAAEPGIRFESDPNTGIYSPGADQLAASTGGTERLRITSAGLVGIGTSSPSYLLHVNTAAATDVELAVQNSAGLARYGTRTSGNAFAGSFTAGKAFELWSANAQAVTIDSSGRLLVGTSSSRQVNASIAAVQLQIEGTTYQSSSMSLVTNQNVAAGSFIVLGKSRGTSLNSSTIVNNNDSLGALWFCGADGNTMPRSATIEAFVDGTPGADDMPGRLVFSTTADGASSPTERLRITSAGVLQIADAGDITVGTSTGTKIGTATTQKIGFYNATPVVQPTAVADATDAASVITQLNALLTRMRNLGLIAT